MERKDIEEILSNAGWIRTISAPLDVVDYQRLPAEFKERVDYNRLIIYPEYFNFLNEKRLRKLMETPMERLNEVWSETEMEDDKRRAEPVTLPEGLETVPFEMVDEANATQVETIFLAMIEDTHEFRSAVNFDSDVRTMMYEKGKKYGGTPVRVSTISKEMAWSLQQTIDWQYTKQIKIVAVRRKGAIVEVAYLKLGIPEPPPKEAYIHFLEKTDGWTLEKHEKRRR